MHTCSEVPKSQKHPSGAGRYLSLSEDISFQFLFESVKSQTVAILHMSRNKPTEITGVLDTADNSHSNELKTMVLYNTNASSRTTVFPLSDGEVPVQCSIMFYVGSIK